MCSSVVLAGQQFLGSGMVLAGLRFCHRWVPSIGRDLWQSAAEEARFLTTQAAMHRRAGAEYGSSCKRVC